MPKKQILTGDSHPKTHGSSYADYTPQLRIDKALGLDKPPTQQNISYAWEQFSGQTKTTLDAAATGIALEARDHASFRMRWYRSTWMKTKVTTMRTSQQCLAHTCASTEPRLSNSPAVTASASSTPTELRIEFTHVPFHVWPWIDKDEAIPKAEYPPMVSGYKDNEGLKHGYTFATITIRSSERQIVCTRRVTNRG